MEFWLHGVDNGKQGVFLFPFPHVGKHSPNYDLALTFPDLSLSQGQVGPENPQKILFKVEKESMQTCACVCVGGLNSSRGRRTSPKPRRKVKEGKKIPVRREKSRPCHASHTK